MVSHQHSLAKIRDTIQQVLSQGKANRNHCLNLPDSLSTHTCLDSLEPLRARLRDLRTAAKFQQDSVGVHVGRCNPATYKAWQDLELLRQTSDSFPNDSTTAASTFDRLVEFEFASVWNDDLMARKLPRPSFEASSSNQLRAKIKGYLGRKGSQNPSTMTHFLLAVLDYRDGRYDLAMAQLRKIPARDSATPWIGPVSMLYGQILAPTSPDSAIPLLLAARHDPDLVAPASFLLANIELNQHRPLEAIPFLSTYLETPPGPSPGSRDQVIRLYASALVRLAGVPYKTHDVMAQQMPNSARDSIAFQVAKLLLAENAPKECLEILSSFQVKYPGTQLGEEARQFLSQVRRNRPGIMVRFSP